MKSYDFIITVHQSQSSFDYQRKYTRVAIAERALKKSHLFIRNFHYNFYQKLRKTRQNALVIFLQAR